MLKKWLFGLLLTVQLSASEYFVVSPNLSPYAGAYDLRYVHTLLQNLDNKNFLEDAPPPPFWQRFLSITLWNVFGSWESVCQHEYFGHGFRIRDLGIPGASYIIYANSGATHFEFSPEMKLGDYSAIVVGGLEAQDILAHQVKMDWIKKGKIDPRETALYINSHFATLLYAQLTYEAIYHQNRTSADLVGNDIMQFLIAYNNTYPDAMIGVHNLLQLSLLNLIDPITWYAGGGYYYYLYTGKSCKVHMIPIRSDLLYLPNLRMSIAPFGPEVYFENYFLLKNRPLYIYTKGGNKSLGFGFACDEMFSHKWGTLGLGLHLWQYTQYLSSATYQDLLDLKSVAIQDPSQVVGGAISVKNFISLQNSNSLFVEISAKTAGYIQGYSQHPCITFQIGYSL